ncbi:MAG: hypothetical protein Q9M29_02720, partial [Mariprofundaceae bacterium]|nr:hypothetical protein [Mariprofundaceae bacterium]
MQTGKVRCLEDNSRIDGCRHPRTLRNMSALKYLLCLLNAVLFMPVFALAADQPLADIEADSDP